ncbi:MAG: hypothetical protein V7701_11170, partial [Sneathiella sp.]
MKLQVISLKFIAALAATLLLMTALATAEPTRLTFLHTNDMDQISGVKGNGGFAELSALLMAERKRSPNSITTFGGDLI